MVPWPVLCPCSEMLLWVRRRQWQLYTMCHWYVHHGFWSWHNWFVHKVTWWKD
jgi:hypothetical protein